VQDGGVECDLQENLAASFFRVKNVEVPSILA